MKSRDNYGVLIILSILLAAFIMASLYFIPRNRESYTESRSITTKSISIESGLYQISIKYPFLDNKIADNIIDVLIHNEVSKFKKMLPAKKLSHNWVCGLWMDHKTWKFSKDVVSVKFENYVFTGGAHGNTAVITKVINERTGKEYSIKDIFRSGIDYPKILSELIIPGLTRKLGRMSDKKWIQSGAGPKKANFKKFVLTPKELVVYFDQSSVGPYAAGIQEGRISLAHLKKYLNPPFNQ
jgi:hypothetical protein